MTRKPTSGKQKHASGNSDDVFRLLFFNNPMPMLVYDLETLAFLEVNDAAIHHYGYTRDEFLAMTIKDIRPPEDVPRLLENVARAPEGLEDSGEWRHRMKDGRVIDVAITSHTLVFKGRKSKLVLAADITERNRAQKELRKKTEELEQYFTTSLELFCIADTDGHFRRLNRQWESVLGYPLEELEGRRFLDFVHPDDIDETIQAMSRLADQKEVVDFVNRYRCKDGSYRWLEWRSSPAGKIVYAAARDITESRWARSRLEASETRFRTTFEQAAVGIAHVAPDGAWLRVNQRLCDIVGYSREELATRTFQNIIHPDDVATTLAQVGRLLAGEIPNYALEQRYFRRDGSIAWINLTVALVRKPDGEPDYFIAVVEDITTRKHVEDVLRETEQLYRTLFEQSPDAVMVLDPVTTLPLEFNDRVLSMTGYSREEFANLPISDYEALETEADTAAHMAQVFQNGSDTFETRWRGKDGRLLDVLVFVRVTELSGKPMLYCVVRDITERAQIQAQLNQAQRMESVGRLAGGIAHDFNNLLTVINGIADLGAMKLREGDPQRADLVEIRHAGERAAALTRQLLAFSRRQVLKAEVFTVTSLMANMRDMLQRLIGEDVELVVVPGKARGSVRADRGQLEQVVMNIVVNARDAMPSGGRLTIEVSDVELDREFAMEHPSMQPGPHVMLSISDTGIGMDEATRTRIFEPFFTTKEPGKGTGLGLSTAYGIVKQSGGSIWVDSEPGAGTTFKMYLPRVEVAALEAQAAPAATAARGTETILIVEDEDAVRGLAQRILRSAGYRVLAARNGGEALLLLEREKEPVHLMVTDVVMPGMSGRELAERLGGIHPAMKVLYTSGYTDDAIVRHGVVDESAPFLGKPYSMEELRRKVREVLDSARPATA